MAFSRSSFKNEKKIGEKKSLILLFLSRSDKSFLKNPVAGLFGKVYHVQNLAPKDTSSGLKHIQGIGLLKPSGVHLHTATPLLRHSSGGPQQQNGSNLIVQFLYWPWFREMWSDFKQHRTAPWPSELHTVSTYAAVIIPFKKYFFTDFPG